MIRILVTVVFHIFFIYLSFCQKFITPSTFLNLSYITDPHFMSFSIQSMVEFDINCTILLFNCFSPQVAVSGSSCELTCSTRFVVPVNLHVQMYSIQRIYTGNCKSLVNYDIRTESNIDFIH